MKNTIYKELKAKIMSGKLLPGSSLVEREISDEYNISRTPVREILWRLVSDGLLEQEPSRGYIIRKISLEEIFDIFQSREGIEGMAARLACQKGDDNFFSNIKRIRKRIKEIDIEKNCQESVVVGRNLHDLIITTANNNFLSEFYNKLRNITALTRNITRKSVSIEKKSKELHLAIINALEEKDEEKSEYCMREHLRTTCQLMVNHFYPSLFKQIK